MGVYIKNITKDDFAEDGALMWGKRIILISSEDIIPVQDHGDLIDRDELIENSGMCVCDFGTPDERWRPDRDWYLGINAQPVVIPAERSEE